MGFDFGFGFGFAQRSQATPAPVITTSSLDNATQDAAYSMQLAGTNVSTWSLQSGTLPTGVTLSAAGLLSGTPTNSGTFSNLVIRATGAGGFVESTFSMTVTATLASGATLDLNPILANLTISDTDKVDAWANVGSAGGSMTATTTARPAYAASAWSAGVPGLTFDGTDDTMVSTLTLDNIVNNNAKHVFIVAKVVAYKGASTTWFADSSSRFRIQNDAGDDGHRALNNDGATDTAEGGNVAAGTGFLIEVTHDGVNLTARVNANSAGSVASGNTNVMTGTLVLNGGLQNMIFARIIAYDSVLNAAGIERNRNYCNQTYGVTIS